MQVQHGSVILVVDRFAWFQQILDADRAFLTLEEIRDLVMLYITSQAMAAYWDASSYISRFDDEIDQAQASQRPGRPVPKRLDQLRMAKGQETDEFRKGFVLPDLTDAKNVAVLKAWKGDYSSIATIRQLRVKAGEHL